MGVAGLLPQGAAVCSCVYVCVCPSAREVEVATAWAWSVLPRELCSRRKYLRASRQGQASAPRHPQLRNPSRPAPPPTQSLSRRPSLPAPQVAALLEDPTRWAVDDTLALLAGGLLGVAMGTSEPTSPRHAAAGGGGEGLGALLEAAGGAATPRAAAGSNAG